MKYILDFDRTLFDTDAFKKEQAKCLSKCAAGALETLDEIDIAAFLFDDALEFLATHDQEDLFVVSSCCGITGVCDTVYQRTKIEKSGIVESVQDVHIVFDQKTKKVRSLCAESEAVFVDDMLRHVERVKEMVPDVHAVHITRTGVLRDPNEKEDAEVPTIANLTELDAVIAKRPEAPVLTS